MKKLGPIRLAALAQGMLAAALLLAAGCDDGGAVFVEHLAIVNINPSHGAVGIGYDTDVTVTFSEVLEAQSVTGTSICLRDTAPADTANPCSSGVVLANVSYTAETLSARIVPGTPLLPDVRYTVWLTPTLTGDASGALPAIVSASFRTIPTNP